MIAPLKYALVGCGKVAAKHLKAALFHNKDLVISALVDLDADAASKLCCACGLSPEKQAAIPVYREHLKMLAEQAPDLVAITTSSSSHFEIARAAIESGAHVLIEKPMTLSLKEADWLLSAAREKQVRIAVGHIYRYFPLVRLIREELHKGVFGRVLYGEVKVRWGHDQAYYEQASWRGSWAEGGGALINQSIHALDLLAWLMGSQVLEVSGWIGRLSHKMEAEDFGLAMLRLESGGFCQIEGTTCTNPDQKEASFAIFCTQGEIRCGIFKGKPHIRILDQEGRNLAWHYLKIYLKKQIKEDHLRSLFQMNNPHSGLYRDLIRAIHENREPLADGLSGRKAVELIFAIYQSAYENKPVLLPLGDFSIQNTKVFF